MKVIITIEGQTYTEFPNLIQGDFGFDVYFTVKNNDSSAINLDGYSVSFKARKYGESANQIDGSCEITNTTSGICKYTITSSDLLISGKYEAELETTYGASIILSSKLGNLIIVDEL